MSIRRSWSVLLSHPAVRYPNIKCRSAEFFPGGLSYAAQGGPSTCARCRDPSPGWHGVRMAIQINSIWIPQEDIFAMDSKELSSISDCFGDQKAIKTPKLNTIWLEFIARVINMLIGLKGDNYYSKVFKRVYYKLSNSIFWVVITPPNRHIASPLAMKERKIKTNSTIIYNIMLINKQFSSGMMI